MPVLQRLKVMAMDDDPQRRILLVDCLNAMGIAHVSVA
jgi:hypothetical protein